MTRIPIDKLEEASAIILKHLRDSGISSVELDEDFYWIVEKNQKYHPYQKPQELNLGQLSDDWQEIEKIVSGDGVIMGHALVWLASLYYYLGEKHPG